MAPFQPVIENLTHPRLGCGQCGVAAGAVGRRVHHRLMAMPRLYGSDEWMDAFQLACLDLAGSAAAVWILLVPRANGQCGPSTRGGGDALHAFVRGGQNVHALAIGAE